MDDSLSQVVPVRLGSWRDELPRFPPCVSWSGRGETARIPLNSGLVETLSHPRPRALTVQDSRFE